MNSKTPKMQTPKKWNNWTPEQKRAYLVMVRMERLRRTEYYHFFRPQPYQVPFDLSTALRILIHGGNRCLAGWQHVFDPVAGQFRQVDQIREPWHVWAWDGNKLVVAEAEAPFPKDTGLLCEYHLSNGQAFAAAPTHMVLTAFGTWASLNRVASEQIPLASNWGLVPSIQPLSAEGGPNLSWMARKFGPEQNPCAETSPDTPLVVTKVVPVEIGVKWDFTVPKYHNYYLAGAIHHNSGKTMHAIFRILRIMAGKDPYNETHGWKPPIHIRVCGAGMHEQVLKVLVEWFKKLTPRSWLEGNEFRFNTQTGRLPFAERGPCKGGWVEFMSYDQDPEKGSGRPLHGIAFDEAYKCGERFRNQGLARLLDHHGFAWAIETPEDGDATWSVKWYERAHNPENYADELEGDDVVYEAFRYPTRLNKKITEKAIRQLIRDCEGDEVQIRIRLEGDFISIGGIVYPMLKPSLHVRNGADVGVDGSWVNSIAVDPKVGVNKEHCVTWYAVGPGDSIHFYRELYCTGTMADMMHNVRAETGPHERLASITFDPHWDWDNQLVKKPGKEEPFNLYESLVEAKDLAGYHNIDVIEARRDKHVWFGIEQVEKMLQPEKPGCHPQITFAPQCQRLYDEMRRYSCVRQKEKEPTRYRPRIRKVEDDGPDCVRIAVTSPRDYVAGYGKAEIIDTKEDAGYGLVY